MDGIPWKSHGVSWSSVIMLTCLRWLVCEISAEKHVAFGETAMNIGATRDLLNFVCFLEATRIISHTESTSQKDVEGLLIFISIDNTFDRDMGKEDLTNQVRDQCWSGRLRCFFWEPAMGKPTCISIYIYIISRGPHVPS